MSTPTAARATSPLAHQFDDLEQQHDAGEMGMWVFLSTEVLFFGGMFLAYLIYRTRHEAAFVAASRELDFWLGTINTGVLLTSSLTMAMSVHAAQMARRRLLVVLLGATFVLGCVFLFIKGVEYYHKFLHGFMPPAGLPFRWEGPDPGAAELFFDLYFLLTGVHALHMLIGLGIIIVLIVMASRGGLCGEFSAPVHISGLYWHFVDIIWVFLFPLLYLVGPH